jgi:hypothetical protein
MRDEASPVEPELTVDDEITDIRPRPRTATLT